MAISSLIPLDSSACTIGKRVDICDKLFKLESNKRLSIVINFINCHFCQSKSLGCNCVHAGAF